MSEFDDSDTFVFWNVNDWPTRNLEDPSLIFNNIKLHLWKELGYYGSLKVMAYGDAMKSMSVDLKKKYRYAGIDVYHEQGDKFERVNWMVHDIIRCAWRDFRINLANVVILSNISEEVHMIYVLKVMKSKGLNVVVARKSQDDSDSLLSLCEEETGFREWTCPNLLDENLVDERFEELFQSQMERIALQKSNDVTAAIIQS